MTLVDELPRILRRTNGFSSGGLLRGNFTLNRWGGGKLFINRDSPPSLVVRARGTFVVVNFENAARTRELFGQLGAREKIVTSRFRSDRMRRLRYSVAATLDGFIADPNGGYDWIIMDEAIDFAAIFDEFDAFVMGRKTWDVSATDEMRATCSAARTSSCFRGR